MLKTISVARVPQVAAWASYLNTNLPKLPGYVLSRLAGAVAHAILGDAAIFSALA